MEKIKLTKEYLEEQYKIAYSDLKIARDEDMQWEARKRMAKLEQLAADQYGFEYCDQLHNAVVEEQENTYEEDYELEL